MSRFLLHIVSILIITSAFSCSSTRLQVEMPDTHIPSEAETAVFVSSLSADSLFDTVKDSLTHQGYLVDQSNKDLYAISTQSRNIGQNKQMRISFLIEPLKNDNSRMTVRAEWRSIPEPAEQSEDIDADEIQRIGWKSASWSDPKASKRAFAHLVKFIHTIPHETITYK